jgi:predicted GIY-YIG superfamily endonuclease
MYFVYALTDPRTDIVAYVGITNNPNARLQEHISCTGPNDEKKTWVRKLQEEGYEPRMKILEVVDTKGEATAREKYWIQHYTSTGMSITNIRSKPKATPKPKAKFRSLAPEGYYTATEAAERLNVSSLNLLQEDMFWDIHSERRIRKWLHMTYGLLMDHVRAGRIRSIIPPGKCEAVYLKEDVDRISQTVSQPEKNYYTSKEAQEILGMTYSALRDQVNMGNIHSFIPPGNRHAVYVKEDVDQLAHDIKAFWERKDIETF